MGTGLFDSARGNMIHYFVRPNDAFILNSLEKLDADEYLYRVLQEEGYENVFFIGIEGTSCKVWAYDELSYWASVRPQEFARVNAKDPSALAEFLRAVKGGGQTGATQNGPVQPAKPGLNLKHKTRPAATAVPKTDGPSVPAVGRCQMQTFSSDAEFSSFMINRINPALRAGNIKTAIVMPMELFEKRNYLGETVIDHFRSIAKDNDFKNNVIILTTSQRENLINCFNHPDLHYWVPELAASTDHRTNRVDAAVKRLSDEGIIVLADQICEDEIANLLLRKKLIEGDSRLAKLKPSKVYGLAELLAEHCRTEKAHFKTMKPFRMSDYIRQLEKILTNDAVVEELVAVSQTLKPRKVKKLEDITAIQLERVTGVQVSRWEMSQEEMLQDYQNAMAKLNSLIGLESVKTTLETLFTVQKIYGATEGPGHYIFAGNPGTGKTVVARLVGDIFKSIGLLKKGQTVECKTADLVADHIGGSAIKTRKKCEEALDGVLFVDEAYKMVNTEPTGNKFPTAFDEEAYTEIMTFMENNPQRICVIFAGYTDKMEKFKKANPGMESRITSTIEFPDYSAEELYQIFVRFAKNDGFTLCAEDKELFRATIKKIAANPSEEFGNGREMRKLFKQCKDGAAIRINRWLMNGRKLTDGDKYTLLAEDIPEECAVKRSELEQEDSYEKAMEDLNEMIGLSGVKHQISSLANSMRYPVDPDAKIIPGHYVFAGNPGTGKTVVARMVARILKSIGILSKTEPVEVSRVDLVAGYVGQSAIKTLEKCKEALGGVLFVDEAYTLFEQSHSGADFGKEALETIMKFMEDNKDKICVIFAGYEDRMTQLMQVNSGFNSRISEVIYFEDYSVDELVQILQLMARKQKCELSEDFIEKARKQMEYWLAHKDQNFGNARDVRKLLEKANKNRGNRIAAEIRNGVARESIQMNLLVAADLDDAPVLQSDEKQGNAFAHGTYHKIVGDQIRNLSARYGIEATENKKTLTAATASSVLFVRTNAGAGTAFLISPDGYALTCNHVIEGATKIDARFRMPGRAGGEDSWHTCKVINTRKDLDIALIKLEGSCFPYLKLAAVDRTVEQGEEFILNGYPFGERTAKDMSMFTGHVASTYRQTDSNGFIRFNVDCQAKCGNSGSPIISLEDGCVIGILLGSMTNESGKLTEEINYMRPILYFWQEFVK